MTTKFADYQEQRAAFDDLCKPQCDKPILFFEGESGLGKTALLRDCKNRIPEGVKNISFDCKNTTISISEIFSRSVHRFGQVGLSEFGKSLSSLSRLNINVADIKQLGDQNTIDIALRAENEAERETRRTLLTNSWFRDLQKLEDQLLVIFDTFEKAGLQIASWLCGPFLARVSDTPRMRVAIAGQRTPDLNPAKPEPKRFTKLVRYVIFPCTRSRRKRWRP